MRWYWVILIVAAAFIAWSSMMRTAYDSGRATGENDALQKYYLETGVCMPEIQDIIRICEAKLANASQNYHASRQEGGSP